MVRIIRMDEWDREPRGWRRRTLRCDMKERYSLHRKGDLFYVSMFRTTKVGVTFEELKMSQSAACAFSEAAVRFISQVVRPDGDWCIVTAPRRRHADGYHLATEVCRKIAAGVKIRFYENAIQCTDKDRINPEFFLLRPIREPNVIFYDDIITTGSTMLASYDRYKQQIAYETYRETGTVLHVLPGLRRQCK